MTEDSKESYTSNYISNYLSIVLVYFLRMIVPFLIIVLIGRFYSQEEFGRYAVASAFMGVVGLILNFGLSNVVSFEIASLKKEEKEYREKITEILKISVIVFLIFSIMSLLLTGTVLYFINYSAEIKGIIIALFFGYFFMAINFIMSGVFIGMKEMKALIPSYIAILMFTVGVVTPFIFLKKSLYLIASLWSLSQSIGIWIFLFLLKKKSLLVRSEFNKRKIPMFIKRSIGVGLENVVFRLGTNLANILLPFYLTAAQIGIFNGAFKPFVLLIAGNQITFLFFNPYIASKRDDLKREKERILEIFGRVNMFFSCTIIILPLFFSHFINTFIFGNKLLDSISYMALLAIGYLVCYLPPYSFPLKALGKEWKASLSSIGQLIINVFAIIIFVPRYGIRGAVYAILVSFLGYWIVNILVYVMEELRPISNIYPYISFIIFSLLNGLLVKSVFGQIIHAIAFFLAINLIGAYFIFLSKTEKKVLFSYLRRNKTNAPFKS